MVLTSERFNAWDYVERVNEQKTKDIEIYFPELHDIGSQLLGIRQCYDAEIRYVCLHILKAITLSAF